MKKFVFLSVITLLFLSIKANAQSNDPQNMQVTVNQEAHYPAGDAALYQLIYSKLQYPEKPKGTLINGKVILNFDVLPDSTLNNIVVMQGVDDYIDNQIVNTFKQLKFAPSIQNHTPVKMNVMYTVQITKRYN